MQIDGNVLIGYTDWERQKWHDWLAQHSEALKSEALKTSMGPHGDNQTVGDVVKHIFSAEKRYIERLSDQPLTDTTSIPNGNLEALFELGQQSRQGLKDFIESFPVLSWDIPKDFEFVGWSLRATPKKIIIHFLTHEICHWAQIASLFRLNGFKSDFHDFIFSPVLGGEFRSEQAKASQGAH
jgi:uncharacterized damage-inducible protein DinB